MPTTIRNMKELEKVMKQQIQTMMEKEKQQIEKCLYDYIDAQNYSNITGFNRDKMFDAFRNQIDIQVKNTKNGSELCIEISNAKIDNADILKEEIGEKFLKDIPVLLKKQGLNVVKH